MESCTGGMLANEITNIKNASLVFKFGAVTYSNEFKIKMNVSKDLINKYSVYSMEVAKDMSYQISNFTNSDYNILTMTPRSANYVTEDGITHFYVNTIQKDNTMGLQEVTRVNAAVRISMYLDEDVYIKSGNGTQANPYVLEK